MAERAHHEPDHLWSDRRSGVALAVIDRLSERTRHAVKSTESPRESDASADWTSLLGNCQSVLLRAGFLLAVGGDHLEGGREDLLALGRIPK